VARCLERKPELRFQSSSDVAAALLRSRQGRGPPRRKLILVLAGTALAGASVAGHRQLGSLASGFTGSLRSLSSPATAAPVREQVLAALRAGQASVAVLPLRNLSQRSDQDWL